MRNRAERAILKNVKAEIVRTTALFPSAVFLQWNVLLEDGDAAGDFFINVDRAGGPEGPWERVAATLRNAYHYLDNKFDLPPAARAGDLHEGFNLFTLSRTVYYRISIVDATDTSIAVSDPAPIEPGLDVRTRLFKRKILRDESVAFRALNGVPLYALKRRQWGTRCRECFDPATKENTQEHCATCYGTTFEGGYWTPVLIRGRKDPAPVQTQLSAHGLTDRQVTTFIILDYPHIERLDIIVDLRRNDRWLVEASTPTELKGVTVHQKLVCSNLSHNSVEYAFPVDRLTVPPLY